MSAVLGTGSQTATPLSMGLDKKTIAIAVGATAAVAVTVYLYRRATASAATDISAIDDSPAPNASDASVATPVATGQDAGAAGAAEAPLSSADEARRAKERGNKRFAGKQYEAAITEYTKAIGLADPTDPEVAKYYGNRAQCHACLEQHANAESDCDASLRCDPSYVKAIARRATAREKLGKDDGALVDFTGALLLSGMNHPTASESVDRLVKRIAARKAEAKLKEPMRCLPSASFISTFVDSFRDHRELLHAKPKLTEKQVEAALSKASGGARAALLVQRALARMRTKTEYEGAMRDWAAAVRLISPLGDHMSEDSAAAPSAEQRASTLAEWSADSAIPPPSLALSMLGMFLHLRGNYDSAMECYGSAIEMAPKSIDVLLKRSSLWFEKEQLPKAFEDFDAALAIDDQHADSAPPPLCAARAAPSCRARARAH